MLSPFAQFDRRLAEVDRLVSLVARPPRRSPHPELTLTETKDAWVVQGLVPGWPADALDLQVESGVLTLTGDHAPSDPEGFAALQRERTARSFKRRLRIPDSVDQEAISATARNGVLTVTLPRKLQDAPRRIPVQAA